MVKKPPASAGDMRRGVGRPLGWEGPLEEGMATHSSILAWRIPWTEEAVGLQSVGLRIVGHDERDSACALALTLRHTPRGEPYIGCW